MNPNKPAERTDEQLLELIRENDDRAAFAELYNRYWEPLINAAYQRLRTTQAAEEVVQEVFVSFFIRRKEINLHSTLEAYLRTALKYKVYNTYRSLQTHQDHIEAISAEQDIAPITPDLALEAKELREKILRISEKMPEKCREVFLLSRFEQLSQQEIADKLDISVSTVKKHITKALNIMREEFKGHHPDLLAVCFLIYLSR